MSALVLSTYAGKRDNAPQRIEGTWCELVASLREDVRETDCTVATCEHRKCPHKDGGAWSPAVYAEGTRGNRNVESVSALVIDVDHVEDDVFPTIEPKLAGRTYAIHASHSDRPGDRCVRVVLALTRPVVASEWSQFWCAAIAMLGLPGVDPSPKDPSRLFFLPSRPSDAPYHFAAGEGAPLDVDQILANAPAERTSAPRATVAITAIDPDEFGAPSAELIAHVRERLRRHGPAIEGSGGNTHTRAAWGILVNDYALADEEARSLIEEWNTTCEPPWDPDELYSGPAREGQNWNAERGSARVSWEAEQAIARGLARSLGSRPEPTTGAAVRHELAEFVSEPNTPSASPASTALVLPPVRPLFRSISDIAAIEVPPLRTYTTGLAELDARLGGGLSTRALHVIISRTGAGKTGAALGVLIRNAKAGVPQLYVSTELDANEAFMRVAAQLLHVPHRDLLMGKVPRHRARDAVHGLPIEVVGQEDLPRGSELTTIGDAIAAVADKYGKPPIACVDYLQMLTAEDPHHLRMGVSAVANGLRAISQRHDCVMIGVSSAARMFYRAPKDGADDPLSYLGAAKESGDVEFAAASILYLDVGESDPTGSHVSRIVVAKARRGTAGFVGARFNGPTGCWTPSASAAEQMSGEARRARVDTARHAEYEATILKAIIEASKQPGKPYRTRRAWRDMRAILKVPEKEIEPAITRLEAAGKVVLTYTHPRKKCRERYELVVLANDPSLPPVGVLGVRDGD